MLDVTERKKLESDLAQAQKLESVGRLASGIAHEINTPVQFVSDSIHFVRDGTQDLSMLIEKYQQLRLSSVVPVSSELAADIARAEESVDLPYLLDRMPKALDRALSGLGHVAVIVRSMKEFAHPDQKDKTGIDLNKAIASTLMIANNECKYVADVETDFGELPAVNCFAGDINQVILNVVVNAAHAIGDQVQGTDRKGRINVQTCHDGEHVVIAISDTGSGIPSSIRDKIFDPFFTTKGVGRGTGQGLAIARSIVVDRHGGTIEFETEVGRGTTFFIRLPIGEPVAVEVA
jgi:signal transduction histidine kinase